MRAITVAMNLTGVVTRQCEYIIKIFNVLIFPLVALLHCSLARSVSIWKDLNDEIAEARPDMNIKVAAYVKV